MRRRLDAELVRRGIVESRTRARQLIEDGRVRVGGSVALKAARQVDAGESVIVVGERPRFVGRGGEKLSGALDAFGLDPQGLRVLDAGASTGGFTDCLLQEGAVAVTALDVGHGQLHESLRSNESVTVIERTNIRHVDPEEFGPFDAVVADLSFISLRTVMSVLVGCCAPDGWLVLLVKPQFEVGRKDASKGRGVVGDPALWREVLGSVCESAMESGAVVVACEPSPIRGGDGNVEFLLHLRRLPAGAPGAHDAFSAGALGAHDDLSPGAPGAHDDLSPGGVLSMMLDQAVADVVGLGEAIDEPPATATNSVAGEDTQESYQ